MKTIKLRAGAVGFAGLLATATVLSAFALQGDGTPAPGRTDSAAVIEDEPIRYAGGYGLYPTVK